MGNDPNPPNKRVSVKPKDCMDNHKDESQNVNQQNPISANLQIEMYVNIIKDANDGNAADVEALMDVHSQQSVKMVNIEDNEAVGILKESIDVNSSDSVIGHEKIGQIKKPLSPIQTNNMANHEMAEGFYDVDDDALDDRFKKDGDSNLEIDIGAISMVGINRNEVQWEGLNEKNRAKKKRK